MADLPISRMALLNIQKYQSAVTAFNQSLAIKKHWKSYQGLGWSLYNLQKYKSAVNAFKQSLALKESWQGYHDLGWVFFNMRKYQSAVSAFKQSLAFQENWKTYHDLGWALYNMQKYESAVSAFKQSLALEEHFNTYEGLGLALNKIGKLDNGIKAVRIGYRRIRTPYLEIDPFLGVSDQVIVTRDLIETIKYDLSKIEFTFHPSYLTNVAEDNELESWKHLIHIHIPKCAGTNFGKPLEITQYNKSSIGINRKANDANPNEKNYHGTEI